VRALSDVARLEIAIDANKAIDGAQRVRRALHHLSNDTNVAKNRLQELSKNVDFRNLDSAKRHLGGLSQLKEQLKNLGMGYRSLRDEAMAFIESVKALEATDNQAGRDLLGSLESDIRSAGEEINNFGSDVDEAMTRARESVENSARKIIDWFKRILGAYLSFRGVKSFIGSILGETTESESADSALEAALKATGHAAGITASEIKTMAKELQSVTVHSDEAIT
jgi:hypothetical protein